MPVYTVHAPVSDGADLAATDTLLKRELRTSLARLCRRPNEPVQNRQAAS